MKLTTQLRKTIQKLGLDVHRYFPPKYEWITRENIETVFDIGANVGQYAHFISGILPYATIHSFEPIEACYNQLKENTKHLRVIPYNFALGEDNYSAEINVSQHTPSSSILLMSGKHKELFAHTANHIQETIQVKKLDDISTNLNFSGNILVKIDVQGFEAKVIDGGLNVFRNARLILTEINYERLYDSQARFKDIYSKLSNLGFDFFGNINQTINHKTGDIIYSDSLFIKQ